MQMQPGKMQPTTTAPTTRGEAITSSPSSPASFPPLDGIERLMAQALTTHSTPPRSEPDSAGLVEYASWLPLVRRATP